MAEAERSQPLHARHVKGVGAGEGARGARGERVQADGAFVRPLLFLRGHIVVVLMVGPAVAPSAFRGSGCASCAPPFQWAFWQGLSKTMMMDLFVPHAPVVPAGGRPKREETKKRGEVRVRTCAWERRESDGGQQNKKRNNKESPSPQKEHHIKKKRKKRKTPGASSLFFFKNDAYFSTHHGLERGSHVWKAHLLTTMANGDITILKRKDLNNREC